MPKTKEKKKEIISDLEKKAKDQKAMVFVNFKGLKMDDFSELRNELKKINSSLVVSKKKLLNIAFEKSGIEIDAGFLKEEIAVIFGFGDQIAPAKIAHEFSKKNPNLKIAGGFTEGIMRSESEIIALAKLPSREEILASFVRTLQSPISGFANVLQGNIRSLLYVLKQVKA